MNNSIANFLFVVALVIVLLVILLAITAFLAIRQLQRFVSPNIAELNNQLEQLRVAQPDTSTETHVRKIIQQQSLKCGLIGAATGLGGFITLPVALPIDIFMSMRIQATTVQFIAMTYGQSPLNNAGLKLQTYLVTSGSVEVTETTFSLIMKFILRLLGESLSVLVPAIGAVIGFAVNYAFAQATGQMALRWYSGKFSETSPKYPPAFN